MTSNVESIELIDLSVCGLLAAADLDYFELPELIAEVRDRAAGILMRRLYHSSDLLGSQVE